MKVLVVGTSAAVVSGITTAAEQTVRSLQREGFDVARVEAGSHRRRKPSRLNLENVLAVLGDAARVFRAARRQGSDVVWYHTFGMPTLPALRALVIVIAARLAGARAFVRLHPYGFHDWLDEGGRSLVWVLSVLDRAAAGLVVEFDEAAEALRSRTGVRKVSVLPNWVDVSDEPAHLPPAPPFVLTFVGGLIERKGVYELLGAMELLDDLDVRLLLVGGAGEDGEGAQERLEQHIRSKLLGDRVELLGELDASGVRRALQRAHVFVLPTRAEGLPLAMLEAMAEGRPVVVGDAGAIRSLVESVGCGLVLSRRDSTVIASGIRALIAQPELISTCGREGHGAAQELQSEAVQVLAELVREP